ncbi:MAG: hypothetical protein HY078_00065 [Elusimicrobia bacterium]|nr:hypothetical protein [Elusimicrobiota bacterium]
MPKARTLVAVLALGSASVAASAAGPSWHETMTPHFLVKHEAAFLPSGLTLFLERLHNRLRLDLSVFSPWMAKERVKLYLYSDAKSYGSGEFKPPSWSNGIAFYDRRIVAVYDQPEKRKLMEIIAHETTHLLFESYWGEAGRKPPQWLNEGLAMLEEGASDEKEDRTEWSKAMAHLPPNRLIPIQKLLEITPTQDIKDQEGVAFWYVQSYSLVYYLARRHTRLQFQRFCRELRDGNSLKKSLWNVYRIRDVQDLEAKWKTWLQETYHAAPARAAAGEPSKTENVPGRLQPVDFGNHVFHSLRDDREERPRKP